MKRQLGPLAAIVGLLILALASACGDDSSANHAQSEGACSGAVRDEFARQQALVDWAVYCPSELPEGFRLATADDPPIGAPNFAEDARPTLDMLHKTDQRRLSTFVTRLTDGDGHDLVIVQGAGANIYNRRDEARCPGCFEVPRRGAMFGELSGRLYELSPSAVIAWDGDMGHMISGFEVSSETVTPVAAAMHPVNATGWTAFPLSDALLRVIDLAPGDWLPDNGYSDGEDFAQRPFLCEDEVVGTPDAAYAPAFFVGATWPYEDGHPPSLHQAVFQFDTVDDASAYLTGVAAAIGRCVATREFEPQTFTERPLPYEDLGDDSAGYRQEQRSDVQGADTDFIFIRSGDLVTVLWYFETVAAGATTPDDKLRQIARAAESRLRGEPPEPHDAAETHARGRDLARFEIAVFPQNAPYRPWEWSPDGHAIAYIGRDYGAYVAQAPDFTPRRLDAGPAREPRWSPDGKLIAFAIDEGIAVASPALADSTFLVSPPDDVWREKINLVDRWLDETTIAYQVHCGTSCALLFELTLARPGDRPPTTPGSLREIPVVSDDPYPANAGALFHYSDDARYVVANYGSWPQVVWYDRATGERWHLKFDDDPPATDVMREFVRWNPDGTFVYRQATGTEQQATWFESSGLPFAGTRWLGIPFTRRVTQLP
jgi:hypothetical protein